MACSSATAYRSAVVERLLDLLAAVRKLCGKKHLAAFIVHNGDPGGPFPGSSLRRRGWTCGCSMAALKMRVNGYRFSTAALPALSKRRARPGCTGESGCLLVSTRKTKLRVPHFALNVASKLATSGQVSLPKQAHPLEGIGFLTQDEEEAALTDHRPYFPMFCPC